MQEMGKEPVITNPPKNIDAGLDFPENFDREKLASADAFTYIGCSQGRKHVGFQYRVRFISNPYERDALTYQLSIDPEDARSTGQSICYVRDEDYFKYPTQMAAWNRELNITQCCFNFLNT